MCTPATGWRGPKAPDSQEPTHVPRRARWKGAEGPLPSSFTKRVLSSSVESVRHAVYVLDKCWDTYRGEQNDKNRNNYKCGRAAMTRKFSITAEFGWHMAVLRIFAKIKAEAISDDFSSMANGSNIKHRTNVAENCLQIT